MVSALLRDSLDLRERVLLLGPDTLADVDLLVLLLGTGTEGESVVRVAVSLLETCGSLQGVRRLGARGLSALRGIGPAKAARILAALELGQRATLAHLAEKRRPIGSFDEVVHWAQPRLAGLDHEEVWLLSLDGRNGLRTAQRIAQGGLHGCALTPKDVLRPALAEAASAIVLVHNHPSGDPTPSVEDQDMTRAVALACQVVGVHLLDHVVVARSGAASLREYCAF